MRMVSDSETFGLIRPDIDAHTLGVSTIGKLIKTCGYDVFIADAVLAKAIAHISELDNISLLVNWIYEHLITRIGFSYRLDPIDAQKNFGKVYQQLYDFDLFVEQGGPIRAIYFAGLPEACERIQIEYGDRIPVFLGDETQKESLVKFGIPVQNIPDTILESSVYDEHRFEFAKNVLQMENHRNFEAIDRSGYKEYGTKHDSLIHRISHSKEITDLPVTRAHIGPFNSNYGQAKQEFKKWLTQLAECKYLDVLSIGSSQLSQSNFGEDWGSKSNGGGVPINSVFDLEEIWESSRPMLLRTYSGTKRVAELARLFDNHINMAWHALSLWWFNKIDGRGPNTVIASLREHFNALKYIAASGRPFEPNIPHHFAFRGSDDISYVLSAYLAARLSKKLGINHIVIQTMLNTPKYTWGIQDLAKSRALLKLTRELETQQFRVIHQPRAGLDYFSPDLEKAKIQLSSVSMMMDDIEPDRSQGPDIIHVVSYCEAVRLATPEYVNESIQITLSSLNEYRKAKCKGFSPSLNEYEVYQRTEDLYFSVKEIVELLEQQIPNLYSPEGFYQILKLGIFPLPYLWEGLDEFSKAVDCETSIVDGGVKLVNNDGMAIDSVERVKTLLAKQPIKEIIYF